MREGALDAKMEAGASVWQEAGVVRSTLEPAVLGAELMRSLSVPLCGACPSPRRLPCGRRERVKEAEALFVGDGSSVASRLPLQRRAARWAQGVPSSSRPVPCPRAPSSSYAERQSQQRGCHHRIFPCHCCRLGHRCPTPRTCVLECWAGDSHVQHEESEGR